MRGARFLVAGALAAVMVSPAYAAVTVTGSTASSFTVNYNGNVDGTNVTGLTASILFNFSGMSGNTYSFTYTLTNNSSVASRVSGFAFNTAQNLSGASTSGTFSNANRVGNYPNGVGNVDVCFSNNSGNGCSGNGGVTNGNFGTGNFSLTLSSPSTTLTFDDFYVRYQSIVIGNQNDLSGTGVGTPVVRAVPEPATWGMMLLGFGVVGAAVRRRRSYAIA